MCVRVRCAALQVARGLLALGVAKRDRVGIWAPNCAEFTVLQFAAAKVRVGSEVCLEELPGARAGGGGRTAA